MHNETFDGVSCRVFHIALKDRGNFSPQIGGWENLPGECFNRWWVSEEE